MKKARDICQSNTVTVNKEKCQIAVEELTFLGDWLTANRLKLDPAKVNPIVEFKIPKEKNAARFIGIVKYLARYRENLSQRTFHMRRLLKSNAVFTWDPGHEKEFNEFKRMLSSKPLIQFHNPKLPSKFPGTQTRQDWVHYVSSNMETSGNLLHMHSVQ